MMLAMSIGMAVPITGLNLLKGFSFGTYKAVRAKARLVDANGSGVSGIIRFSQTRKGVAVRGSVKELALGKHGFHVHENGATGNNCGDAGGHFNPFEVKYC